MTGLPRHTFLIGWVLVAASALGCSTPRFIPIDPSQPIDLGPDEGLLILHVDSALPIPELSLAGLESGRPIEAGSTFEVFRVPAGLYRWSDFVLSDPDRWGSAYLIDPLHFSEAENLYLDIRPGALNYPGELVVEIFEPTPHRRAVSVRVLNHVGGAIRRLESEYPGLLDEVPLAHALERSSADPFLEFYLSERARTHAADTGGDAAEADDE